MNWKELNRLMRNMEKHGIAVLEYEDGENDAILHLDRRLHPTVVCRQAGRFYPTIHKNRAPDSFPREVQVGEEIGTLVVGPLILPIIAAKDGLLPPPLVAAGEIAGYGEVLF